jgi:formylmethanofuran dehydrogenase subunit E
MNKFSLIVVTAVLALATACNQANNKQENQTDTLQKTSANQPDNVTIYEKAGIIKLRDPKAVMFGYRQPGDDVFEFTLNDVGKYAGHVCAGISSAFLLTKQALDLLYPGDEMPVRGQTSVVASDQTAHLEVASYIVRASAHGEEEIAGIATVDTTLRMGTGKVTLIFKRLDNGKMAKAVFNKTVLMPGDKMQKMLALKQKVINGTATTEEKKQFTENVQKAVIKIITDAPEGLLTVKECTDYVF